VTSCGSGAAARSVSSKSAGPAQQKWCAHGAAAARERLHTPSPAVPSGPARTGARAEVRVTLSTVVALASLAAAHAPAKVPAKTARGVIRVCGDGCECSEGRNGSCLDGCANEAAVPACSHKGLPAGMQSRRVAGSRGGSIIRRHQSQRAGADEVAKAGGGDTPCRSVAGGKAILSPKVRPLPTATPAPLTASPNASQLPPAPSLSSSSSVAVASPSSSLIAPPPPLDTSPRLSSSAPPRLRSAARRRIHSRVASRIGPRSVSPRAAPFPAALPSTASCAAGRSAGHCKKPTVGTGSPSGITVHPHHVPSHGPVLAASAAAVQERQWQRGGETTCGEYDNGRRACRRARIGEPSGCCGVAENKGERRRGTVHAASSLAVAARLPATWHESLEVPTHDRRSACSGA